jgi:predicted SAM-dependent methyltransferase
MPILNFAHTQFLSRSVWSYSKVQTLVAALIRGRKAFMKLKREGLVLDIGCGPNSNSKNINLDYAWHPGVDICCDITRGLPLPDAYVASIFSEHCLEHIATEDAPNVFREMHRVLRPGGRIRIIVPDLEIYVTRYHAKQPMPYAGNDRIEGIYTPAMSINSVMRGHGHQFIYDYETLRELLAASGFIEIRKRKCKDGAESALLLDTPGREIESLYVEACKR